MFSTKEEIDRIIEQYNNISDTTKWKIILLKYGINNWIEEIEQNFSKRYKTKHAIKIPKSSNYQVYDSSKSKNIILSEIIIKDNKRNSSLVKLRYNPKSPISLKYQSKEKKFLLFFKKKKVPLFIYPVEKKGDSIISFVGEDRMSAILFDGCWNWNIGKPCLFCDLNPKRKNYKNPIPNLNDLIRFDFNYKEWWANSKKTYFKKINDSIKKAFRESKPHKHLLIMSGGFIDNDYLWEMIKEFLDNINKAVPLEKFDNYLNVPPPTSNHRKKLEEVKLRGIKQVEFNLEVIGEKNFAFTCPGKSESIGYKNYIKSLYLGTEIFGLGKSRSNFVLGAQPIKDLKKGILNLAEKGVVADYSVFQPKKGTKWQEKQVLQLEDIINFSLELSKIYKKYNFKGIYCSLSSRSSIINEVLESHVA